MKKYHFSIIRQENYIVEVEADSEFEAKIRIKNRKYDQSKEEHICTMKEWVEFAL